MTTNKLARARKLSVKYVLFLFFLVCLVFTHWRNYRQPLHSLLASFLFFLPSYCPIRLNFPMRRNSHVFYFAWNLSGVGEIYHMLWSFSPIISLRLSLVRGDYGAWGS